MKIRNDKEKWVFVLFVSGVSVLASLLITWILLPDGWQWENLIPALVVPLIVAPVASLWAAGLMLKIHRLNRRLEYLAQHDQMTGLLNRAAFFDHFERLEPPRGGSVIIADIDRFKAINDTYGHDAGDSIIRRVSEILKDQFKPDGLAARFGGEEFVGYYRDETLEDAALRAEAIRAAVENQIIQIDGRDLKCTLSMGVSAFDGNRSLDEVLLVADEALYEAKNNGRNQIIGRTVR